MESSTSVLGKSSLSPSFSLSLRSGYIDFSCCPNLSLSTTNPPQHSPLLRNRHDSRQSCKRWIFCTNIDDNLQQKLDVLQCILSSRSHGTLEVGFHIIHWPRS